MKKNIFWATDISLYNWTDEIFEELKEEIKKEYELNDEEKIIEQIEEINDNDLDVCSYHLNKKTNPIIAISKENILFLGDNLNNIFDIDYGEAYWWYDDNDVFCTDKKYDTIITYTFREIKNPKYEAILKKQSLTHQEIEQYTMSIIDYIKEDNS